MKPHVVVIGSGISGLALGWFLKSHFKDSITLSILEKSSRVGGWIRSNRKDGFLFEEGPRSCRSAGNGLATLQLIEELGLQSEVLPASSHARKRYLYCDGTLQSLPNHLLTFLCSPLTRGVVPALMKEWLIAPSKEDDESIYQFISRRLNPNIANCLIDPMVNGIYAGNIHHLSMRSCFPEMYRWEQQEGSLCKGILRQMFKGSSGLPSIFTLRSGMETLVSKLFEKLKDHIHLNCEATSLLQNSSQMTINLKTAGQEGASKITADRVFIALPSHAAVRLFLRSHSDIASLTQQFTTAGVAVVNVGWKKNVLKNQGFGYLVPSYEKEDILGVVWDSSAFPGQNSYSEETRLTVMLGGSHRPDILLQSEHEIAESALKALKKHMDIEIPPDAIHVSRIQNAIPQYLVGHHKKLSELESLISKHFDSRVVLAGSSWYGVAVNDCIAKAKELVSSCE